MHWRGWKGRYQTSHERTSVSVDVGRGRPTRLCEQATLETAVEKFKAETEVWAVRSEAEALRATLEAVARSKTAAATLAQAEALTAAQSAQAEAQAEARAAHRLAKAKAEAQSKSLAKVRAVARGPDQVQGFLNRQALVVVGKEGGKAGRGGRSCVHLAARGRLSLGPARRTTCCMLVLFAGCRVKHQLFGRNNARRLVWN